MEPFLLSSFYFFLVPRANQSRFTSQGKNNIEMMSRFNEAIRPRLKNTV